MDREGEGVRELGGEEEEPGAGRKQEGFDPAIAGYLPLHSNLTAHFVPSEFATKRGGFCEMRPIGGPKVNER